MAFFDSEKSIFSSKPIELYHIFLDSVNYYFTSSDKSIFYAGNKYTPQSIVRKNISQASAIERSDLKFSITNTNPFFPETQTIFPKRSFKVLLYRYQKDENEAILMFRGTLQSVNFNNINDIELTFQNISESLRKNALRYSYQTNCNNVQYSNKCGLNIENYTDEYIVADIQDNNKKIFITTLSNKINDYYQAGISIFNDIEYRNITEHKVVVEGEYVILDIAYENIQVGDTIKFTYGCKQTSDGCKVVNNFDNFFGFERVPSENPTRKPIIK